MAFGTGPWYRRQALRRAGLKPGMQVLDVGTGTGLTAVQAARLSGGGANVTGVDPSVGMLANARLPEGMRVIEGRAEALPAADSSFRFCQHGLRAAARSRSARDVRRVFRALRPGGRVCVLEITQPYRCPRDTLAAYVSAICSAGRGTLGGRSRQTPEVMRYLWDSIEACVPPQKVMEQMRAAGFTDVSRNVVLGIFSEYVGSKPAERMKGEM